MTVMTVGADSGAAIAECNRLCVNAFPVRQEGPFADAASLHYGLITVTSTAGLSNVRTVYRRLWIAGREQCCQVAVAGVAIHALGARPISFGECVEAALILAVRAGMKQCPTEIGKALTRTVTIVALKVGLGRSCICRRC